ncbi:ABC transporter permease [Lysinibacillus sp. NPDC094403]|uniref:ABC transporter permease n=1 Tax=Lysinibacillus sp. NPDC094403 TaxID=3390581 RepID=UPI003D078C85
MKDVIWLMKKILSVTFRKKRNILLYFGMPLIGIVIAFLAYGGSSQQALKVGVINHDSGQIAGDTVNFLNHLENMSLIKVNESSMKEQIAAGKLDCAIILDEGFSESIQTGNPKHIQLVSIKGAEVTGFVKAYLYQYLDNVMALNKAADGDQNAYQKMSARYQQADFKFHVETLQDTSKGKNMTNWTIGFLLMIMLLSAGNFAGIIMKEKENRTYFRLLSTPINARKYVLANIAVSMLVMIVQIIFTLLVVTNVFHIEMHVPIWQMSIILILFALVAAGLSLMIVSFSNSSRAASAMQNLIFTPSCLLAGCFFPFDIMPKTVQKIANFIPQRWVLDTISQLQQGYHFGSLYLNFMILLAFAAVFFLVSVYKFGRNNDVRNFA